MATKQPVLVVLQLSGGNDFMNTVIPYGDPLYYEFRRTVGVAQDRVLKIDDHLGFHPALGPIKGLYDQGKVAIVAGIGYPQPDRSHFRSMDIWHTAQPEKVVEDGWLGKMIRELDPQKQNVCTGVSFGLGLPRAMQVRGTPAVSVSQLERYGLLTSLPGERQRRALTAFTCMYLPEEVDEADVVLEHIGQTGMDALAAVDMLKKAPVGYQPAVEYATDQLSQSLKAISQVHLAGIGTRIFYAQLGGFDTHGAQIGTQTALLTQMSRAVDDFFADLRAHQASDNVVMLIFTEFGRRVRDNGNGTDHGSGGGAFVVGDGVKGGLYAEYPSLDPSRQLSGDLQFNNDFRSLYSTVIEDWFGVPPEPVVNGRFEKFPGLLRVAAA
jgi:uncharacterized protein (DUF1501 family)